MIKEIVQVAWECQISYHEISPSTLPRKRSYLPVTILRDMSTPNPFQQAAARDGRHRVA